MMTRDRKVVQPFTPTFFLSGWLLSFRTLLVVGFCLSGKVALADSEVVEQNASFEEKRLATIPDVSNTSMTPYISPYGTAVAFVMTSVDQRKVNVVFKGKIGPKVNRVTELRFSPSGQIIYFAQRGKKQFVVIGDQEGNHFDSIPYLLYNSDGSQVAYWGVDKGLGGSRDGIWTGYLGGIWTFVIGTQKSEPFDDSDHSEADGPAVLEFSPDGKTVAYEARKGDQWFVVVGNQKSEGFDSVSLQGFSPDGRPVYLAAKDDKSVLVIGNERVQEFDQLMSPILFSSNGERMAYVIKKERNGKDYLIVDGQVRAEEDYIDGRTLLLSDSILTYVVTRNGKACLVTSDGEGDLYDQIFEPMLSPNGKTVAYRAQTKKQGEKDRWRRRLVLGDTAGPEFDWIQEVVFSPDSMSVAYTATLGNEEFVVVNGERGVGFNAVASVVFSPDGQSIAYRARQNGRWRVVIDDKAGEEFDSVAHPLFNSDGTAVVTTAYTNDKSGPHHYIVIGDQKREILGEILTPLVFNSNRTKVAFGTREGLALWWRVIDISQPSPQ